MYSDFQCFQATLATTDNSCESVVTSGQPHLTPQRPPRDASPAGLVGNASCSLCPLILRYLLFVLLCAMADVWHAYIYSRLLSSEEETLTEFLSKATGTAVEWVQMPGMKVTDFFIIIFNGVNLHFIVLLRSY